MAFLNIYNRSLVNTWGFVPMSDAEVRHMATGLRYLIVPELALAAELDGKMIGAAFGLPDYNPRIRRDRRAALSVRFSSPAAAASRTSRRSA